MVWSEDHKTADAVDEAAVDAAEHDAVDEAEMQEWVEASPEDSNVVHSEGAWPMPAAPDAEATEPFDTPQSVDDVEEDDSALPNSTGTDNVASLPALQLDEDMLRDVVSEIVRQELQGALGERITRNVRKLVRREIHRMLISQEFE